MYRRNGIKHFINMRVDIFHALLDEKYEFTPDAGDYLYELDLVEAGQISKFFDEYMRDFYGDGKHVFTLEDVEELQRWNSSASHIQGKIKALSKAKESPADWPSIKAIAAMSPEQLKALNR